jgi:hypothetical protein
MILVNILVNQILCIFQYLEKLRGDILKECHNLHNFPLLFFRAARQQNSSLISKKLAMLKFSGK